jgi:hypothetical protein
MQEPDTIILGVDNAAQLRANAETLDAGEAALDRGLLARLKASSGFKSYEETRLRTFFEIPESRGV